jgi:hypothetical protein
VSVHRVAFSGTFVGERMPESCLPEGIHWQATHGSPDSPDRHFVLMEAENAARAVATVEAALRGLGEFREFASRSFPSYGAECGCRPFVLPGNPPNWDELDLDITDVERRLLESLLDDIEATWVLLRDHPDLDRAAAEQSLRRLEEIGFVASAKAMSCNPVAFEELDNYWAITDDGWDRLGLIRSPRSGELA